MGRGNIIFLLRLSLLMVILVLLAFVILADQNKLYYPIIVMALVITSVSIQKYISELRLGSKTWG